MKTVKRGKTLARENRRSSYVARLEKHSPGIPKVIRIVETFASRPNNKAVSAVFDCALHEIERSRPPHKALILVTCGGCVTGNWPPELVISDVYNPSDAELRLLRDEGERVAREFLKPFMKRLRKITQFVSLGVDCSSVLGDRSAELVVIFNVKTKTCKITGKSYPTISQQGRVVCFPIRSHVIKLPSVGHALVLGCHDMNLFSNRALATASPNGFRHTAIRKMRKVAKSVSIALLLHHPHYTDSTNIWKSALGVAEREMPTLDTFVSSGRWWRTSGKRRMPLSKTLLGTTKGAVQTVVVSRAK